MNVLNVEWAFNGYSTLSFKYWTCTISALNFNLLSSQENWIEPALQNQILFSELCLLSVFFLDLIYIMSLQMCAIVLSHIKPKSFEHREDTVFRAHYVNELVYWLSRKIGLGE